MAKLLRRFSPSLQRLGVDGHRLLREGGTGQLILVGRELSLFLHLDATNVPARQRPAFAAMQVRRAAPFSDPEHDVAWFGDHAAIWYWSRERVRSLAAVHGGQAKFRAEACFRGEVSTGDGVELLALESEALDGTTLSAGYEARIWRGGHPVGSRWWPALPDEAAWRTFLRGGGLSPAAPLPAPRPAPVRDDPLGGSAGTAALLHQFHGNRTQLAVGTGVVLIAALAWQLASILAVSMEIRQVESAAAPLERELEAIIMARAEADDAASRIDALLSLRPAASQIRMMAEVQGITPGTGWTVTNWHQPGPETLEVTLRGTGLDASQIVTAWEESPLFEAVTPSTSRRANELMISARLTPLELQD